MPSVTTQVPKRATSEWLHCLKRILDDARGQRDAGRNLHERNRRHLRLVPRLISRAVGDGSLSLRKGAELLAEAAQLVDEGAT